MISNYRCRSCDLRFSVGWYHFHSPNTDFDSAMLFVCSSCGTAHRIMYSLGSGHFCLSALRAPAIVPALDLTVLDFKSWRQYQATGELRPKNSGPQSPAVALDDLPEHLDPTRMTCHFCHQKGQLVSKWDEDNSHCPGCHANTLTCESIRIT